jgi:UDP-N-acetylmuramyl tripeptide synthase
LSSRKINGRHPLLPAGGAALDVDLPRAEAEAKALLWGRRVHRLAALHGLGPVEKRVSGGHVTLALGSPPDLRDLAAAVLDQAVSDARTLPKLPPSDPKLRACLDAAAAAGVPAFFDDELLTVGLGASSRSWPRTAVPESLALAGAARIPFVLVTGTNGKTTTCNLLAAIAAAAGHRVGRATSVGVNVAGRWVERGDWSGPGAARIVFRDRDVTFAVLETARGGILRRGIAVDGADAAIVTNVSADHLGDYGVDTLPQLARVKLTVALSLRPGGTVVLRADDAVLQEAADVVLARRPDVRRVSFSTTRRADAWLDGDRLVLHNEPLLAVGELPLALGGAARHNVENALAAALAADALGLGRAPIVEGLGAVTPDPEHLRGRSNVFRRRGGTLLVDYAHNPDAFERLGELADRLAPKRRWMLLGQAGDRPDALLRELAASAARLRCDRYVLKPLRTMERGRDADDVVRVLRESLVASGVPAERIETVATEADGVRAAIGWIGEGDLAFVLVHEDLDAVLSILAAP